MRLAIVRAHDRRSTIASTRPPRQSGFARAGDYRVRPRAPASAKPEVELTVLRGSAELVNEHGRTLVRAGQEARGHGRPGAVAALRRELRGGRRLRSWAEDQRDARVGTTRPRYLPPELRYYSGAFDKYGTWDYQAPYGVRLVPASRRGLAAVLAGTLVVTRDHFGWFWVGIDRWSWPTHHYGRWGIATPAGTGFPDRAGRRRG